MEKKKTYFNWSTGKDAALALYYLLQDKNYQITQLLTSVSTKYDRVSMHGLKRELLQQQAAALDIPCRTIALPEMPSMDDYNRIMGAVVTDLQQQGFSHAAFGDIFLDDLRVYREQQLAPFNIKAVFPLWKKDSRQLLTEFIALGFKAILVCVNADLLDPAFAGRVIDEQFIRDLPPNVDICGEYGEFHTFCFDGPIFKEPVRFETGEKVYRSYKAPASDAMDQSGRKDMGFWFCDLLPVMK